MTAIRWNCGLLAEREGFEPSCALAQTDFEQLSHRLSLSLTIPNFRNFQPISDRFIAPSEKNARLSQGQRDGRALLFAAVYSFFFLKIGSSFEQSQAPTAIAAREIK